MSALRHTLKLFTGACICSAILISVAQADETTDYLLNPSFDVLDDMNLPVDWKIIDSEKTGVHVVADTEEKMDGSASLKMYVGPDGVKNAIVMSQGFANDGFGLIMAEKFYTRVWIKSVEVNHSAGFQAVAHQGYKPGGPPYWVTKNFGAMGLVRGTTDWKLYEKEFTIHAETNAIICQMYLPKGIFPPCTVWVDGIQISTEPLPPTSVKPAMKSKVNSEKVSLVGSRIELSQSAEYQVQVFGANGAQVVNWAGYGKTIDLLKKQLAPGCYIVKVQSALGDLRKPFVIQPR